LDWDLGGWLFLSGLGSFGGLVVLGSVLGIRGSSRASVGIVVVVVIVGVLWGGQSNLDDQGAGLRDEVARGSEGGALVSLVGKFDKAESLGATVAVLDDVSLDDLLVLEEGLETSIVECEGKVGDEEGRGRLGAVGKVAGLASWATSSWGLVVTSVGVGWGIGAGGREMNNFYTEKKSEKNTTAATIDKRRSHAIDVSDSNDSSAIR
jgi:hypothetical protein